MMFIFVLMVYITIGSYMEVKQFKFGHETGAIIIFGMGFSAIITFIKFDWLDLFEFNRSLFFEVFLPLIIFATAFNMRRKKFFENITNVAKFGVFGTLITFIFYSALTYIFFYVYEQNGGLQAKYYFTSEGEEPKAPITFELNLIKVMYVCSIFCSSDIIAAVTLVKFDDQPKLFSIILGEGLFNDAVAIIFYQTMKGIQKGVKSGVSVQTNNWMLYLTVIGNFFSLSLQSILIGVFFGFACSYITKVWRFYSHSAIAESGLFMCFALFGYFLSEVLELSGIVTLLTTSLILSHYAFFNLSPQGKEVTYVTFQTLGYVSEAIVFGYIGVSATYYFVKKPICWEFILAEFIIVIIGRFAGVYIAYYSFICFPGAKENLLSFAQLSFIAYAALIRGSIAFGLILGIGADLDSNNGTEMPIRDIMESSTCFLVIITTLVFGSFTPLMQRCMLGKPKDPEEHEAINTNNEAIPTNGPIDSHLRNTQAD